YTPEDVSSTIPGDVALCLYRILQEGLRNIVKHARAKEAFVSLTGTGGAIELSIRDSGIGFDPEKEKKRAGLGLVSMQERMHLIQGEFSIRSQPGEGTLIRVWTPIP
ncbi:MAG: PAS domain S-box protein, partial [bacterium]|nr:PAS domain S-box protein [bacterium]